MTVLSNAAPVPFSSLLTPPLTWASSWMETEMRSERYQSGATTTTSASTSAKLRRWLWTTGGCSSMAMLPYISQGLLWKHLAKDLTWSFHSGEIASSATLSTFCGVSGSLVSPQNPDQLQQMHHREHPDWLHDCLVWQLLPPWLTLTLTQSLHMVLSILAMLQYFYSHY